MCDTVWPIAEALEDADDAAVVAAITWWTRAEAAASARRLEAVAELVRRRADGPTDCAHWSCDNWDAMAAEVGAAHTHSKICANCVAWQCVSWRAPPTKDPIVQSLLNHLLTLRDNEAAPTTDCLGPATKPKSHHATHDPPARHQTPSTAGYWLQTIASLSI
jgi:hypothetical protein